MKGKSRKHRTVSMNAHGTYNRELTTYVYSDRCGKADTETKVEYER